VIYLIPDLVAVIAGQLFFIWSRNYVTMFPLTILRTCFLYTICHVIRITSIILDAIVVCVQILEMMYLFFPELSFFLSRRDNKITCFES